MIEFRHFEAFIQSSLALSGLAILVHQVMDHQAALWNVKCKERPHFPIMST